MVVVVDGTFNYPNPSHSLFSNQEGINTSKLFMNTREGMPRKFKVIH